MLESSLSFLKQLDANELENLEKDEARIKKLAEDCEQVGWSLGVQIPAWSRALRFRVSDWLIMRWSYLWFLEYWQVWGFVSP